MCELKNKSFSRLVICFLALWTYGCAHNAVIDLHDGDPSLAAIITTLKTVKIESVDGHPVETGLITDSYRIEISPGTHTLMVIYSDFFEYGHDQFETVKSAAIKIKFHAAAGGRYRIVHDPINTVEAAREYAKRPELALLDANNAAVDITIEYGIPKSLLSALRFRSEEEQVFADDYLADEPDESTLPLLKTIWGKTSSQEREQFLRWIKQ